MCYPMKFQTIPNKFLGKWTYQAQFQNRHTVTNLTEWLSSRVAGTYEVSGNSFYTDDLDTMVAIRLQYDRDLKAIRKFQPV